MQDDQAPAIVFIDEQDVVNARQAIFEDEDHESDEAKRVTNRLKFSHANVCINYNFLNI